MTLEEAKKIAAIVATADGGCSCCVGGLVDLLSDGFPEFHWEIAEDFYGSEEPVIVTKVKP